MAKNTFREHVEWLLDNEYVLAKRDPGLCNVVVDGLGKRVCDIDGQYMIFDPSNDVDGYLLVGDDLEALCAEAHHFLTTT
jgi:hypothetical protein